MMKKVLAILLLAMAITSQAQELKKTSHFELEIDPIAYGLQGYSMHGIYVNRRIRTDIGVFGIKQPEGYGGNKGFQVMTHGIGLKLNYLLNEKETWFGGIGTGYAVNSIERKETNETHAQKVVSVGFHLGYRWFAFKSKDSAWKNLYLAPWCSVDYNSPLRKINFNDAAYKQQTLSFFPTVHVGYKF
ncbi:MAG: hypothetical protein KDC93_17510 [Cyclobacteriaceae bacterium]|nr:hypothetical protein [Cyclobacteriaceae bacterium]